MTTFTDGTTSTDGATSTDETTSTTFRDVTTTTYETASTDGIISTDGTMSTDRTTSTDETMSTDGTIPSGGSPTTTSSTASASAVPVATIVGALVGVIVLLALLLAVGAAFMTCYVIHNKHNLKRLKLQNPGYVVIENLKKASPLELESFTGHGEERRTPTAVNSLYEPTIEFPPGLSDPTVVLSGPIRSDDLYSEIRDVNSEGRGRSEPSNMMSSELYDEICENQYVLIPEVYTEAVPSNQAGSAIQVINTSLGGQEMFPANKRNYTRIHKQLPPPVPEKSSELKQYLDLQTKAEEAQNQQQRQNEQPNGDKTEMEDICSEREANSRSDELTETGRNKNLDKHCTVTKIDGTQPQISATEVKLVGTHDEVEDGIQMEEEDDMGSFTDTRENEKNSQLPRRSTHSSGPVLLSKPVCTTMEDNPTYGKSGSLVHRSHGEEISTDPEARFPGVQSQPEIYEVVYSDSSVQPSIFKKQKDEKLQNSGKKKSKLGVAAENHDDEKEVVIYAPIYSLYDTSPTLKRQPLTVTNDNIREVKCLGTGFFGKVVLADTVGLSLKDLKLSDCNDKKNVSVRVAVKKLKPNASKSTQEAFEKEYRFMSRLDHPNVIRLLGICTTGSSRFIMMEFMERGDLNNYLTKFKMIVSEGVPKEKEILVSTLVYMCTQIANAMKYLVSRNFIHRDLAARNCLVGPNNLIKIADFGMSRNLYESHYYIIHGQAVLPVRWMATECFYGKFSAKTDVWAFGVTMWEIFMLAKERPYSAMEDLEIVNDAIEKEKRTLLQQPEHCPDNVFEVIMRCWAREPKDRATFDELYVALSQLSIMQ